MEYKLSLQRLVFCIAVVLFLVSLQAKSLDEEEATWFGNGSSVVKKDQRRSLVVTEYGEISAVNISDGIKGPYRLQFITLAPNSLFLPVLLHADMVFYVSSGSGSLSWADEKEKRTVDLQRGDIYRLHAGSVFFIQSDLNPQRQSLRIYAIFSNTDDELFEPSVGAYSSIANLIRGFDKTTLKQAFKVPEEVIESITRSTKTEAIVHAIETRKENLWEMDTRFLKAFLGGENGIFFNDKKKRGKAYNIYGKNPDFKNCNGWSLTVNRKDVSLLKGTDLGFYMVNLTKGSMMGPHWNPKATEIAIVLQGHGMVRVVCSSSGTKEESHCKNMRFGVEEGDVFAVPRFHPMAQMSFNNDSLVFVGFSTTGRMNHPQFLAGKLSVLQSLDRDVLAVSFNVTNSTIGKVLDLQAESVILECTSCAEEEERMMEEEREEEEERKRQEERKREEEEARERREEEEERERREEEEEREREEEERKRREEEEEREREEERKRREEEEEREREEEARKREEEEERKRGEEEEEKEREEEEEARKREEEEEERKRREEEEARKTEEEEEEARKRKEEEERKRREEEEARKREEEEERKREGEEARQREEEEEQQRRHEGESEEEMAKREAEEREQRRRREKKEGGGDEGRQYLKMWTV